MAKTRKTGNTREINGRTCWEWIDDATGNIVWRDAKGHAREAPNYLKTVHTSEEAAELATIRHQKRQEAMARGAKKVIGGEYNPVSIREEIAEVAGELSMTMAHDLENPRAALENLKFLMAGVGMPIDLRATKGDTKIAIQINVSPEVESGIAETVEIVQGIYEELDDDVPF